MPNIEREAVAVSLPHRFDIDVCLNGGRHHIEALQMIPQAANIIRSHNPNLNSLRSSTMKRMTDREITCIVNPDAETHLACIGSAIFADAGQLVEIGFMERNAVAKIRDLNHQIRYQGYATDSVTSRFSYDLLTRFEDLIVLIIHCVKKFHQSRYPSAVDIRFTGSRGGDLPLVIDQNFASGKISVRHTRSLKVHEAIQTFNAVSINAPDGASIQCMIGFSYRDGSD
jgi:hypothetical protein